MNKSLFLNALTLVAILLCTLTANAYDFQVGGLYYNITSPSTVEVVSYDNNYSVNSEVVIPENVVNNDVSYTVTSIEYTFGVNDGVTSITIPRTITHINSCYYDQINYNNNVGTLNKVCITDLEAWCNMDFYYLRVGPAIHYGDQRMTNNPLFLAKHLYLNGEEVKDLVIPNEVSEINSAVFLGCSSIISVTIPCSISKIGAAAFHGCNNLQKVIISDIDSWLDIVFEPYEIWGRELSIYGYEYSSNPLYYANHLYLNGQELFEVVIPNSKSEIKPATFINCYGLTSVSIPSSIKKIGTYAFENCNKLNRVIINDIESWMGIDFAFSIDYIYGGGEEPLYIYGASLSCSNPLRYAHHLYLNDQELFDLEIPNTITQIKNGTFWGCSSINTVSIPETVDELGHCSFYGCNNVSFLTCKGASSPLMSEYYWDLIDGWEWYHDGGEDEYPEEFDYVFTPFEDEFYSKTTLQVPNRSLEAYANSQWGGFENIIGLYDFEIDGVYYYIINDSLLSVTFKDGYYNSYSGVVIIPETVCYNEQTYPVTSIAPSCFKDCIDISVLRIPVSITSMAEDAFENCSLESVYLTGEGEWQGGALPSGVKTLYIGSGVTGVKGMQVNPETIYSYATTPPICDENSFTGYDGELHVPASSLAAYFTAPYWCNFTNIIGDAVALTDLFLSQDRIELLVGAEATLRATIAPANAAPANITWQSSDTTVAKVEDGLVTALKRGSCDIIATCQDKRAVCHVTVTEILPTSVALSQETAKIEVGSQLELTATVLPENATDKTVSWSSSNNSVATVDENGVVTGVGQGECDITVWCRGKSAQCHVIVVEHLIYISLDQHEASVLPNHILTLTPTVSPVSTDLVVTSSNPEVAAARMAGGKIQVVGIKEGTATIVVNSADGYAEPDSCQVTVYTERGDVNCDGYVDITDVTSLIDYLLSGNSANTSIVNADCDGGGAVDINDVTLLIDYLLGGTELQPKDEYVQEFTINGVTFTMVRVEGGTFTMGATEEEDSDYQVFKGSPQHQVTLSGYSIGQTEVTQELWLAVMGNNPSHETSDLQFPVDGVSWNDCAEFIAQLNQLTGKQFRLPTEAEWEYAAKGGSKSKGYIYSGSDNLDEVAWTSANSDGHSHQVATKKANELGLYDMNGNIEEWCNDWYSLYTEDPVVNPTGPETGTSRMHRGGRWTSGSKFCRLTRRDGFAPTVTRNYLGLRLAL